MGDFRVKQIIDQEDRYKMYHYALQDIKAFERMWAEHSFSPGNIKIGAEQELCIVDNAYQPANSALEILDSINDGHYTNELGLFNLEINLDPEPLVGTCFSTIENKLKSLLQLGMDKSKQIDNHILMTGILPTLDPQHLRFEYMTPMPRYKTLSNVLREIRGGEFEIYIQGVDDLMASIGSVLFEACNTSFQLHLQIDQEEFVDKFNWAQMIAGPVLSACTNSPLIFGRELWAESRIAVFKQSLDTRNSKNHLRRKVPRVYFGDAWLEESPVHLWKNELMRFPLLLTSDELKDSVNELDKGTVPDLRAIRLHNGTTYTWNRLCYGSGEIPHLRIECRYLPAGPSIIDEIANFVFWIGLMNAVPENWDTLKNQTYFKDVKGNFIRAAREGLKALFVWYQKNIPADQLILQTLLPLASEGLEKLGVEDIDIKKYLSIIEKRVSRGQTGSKWITDNYRFLNKKYRNTIARQEIVHQMLTYQNENVPVHEWDNNHFGHVVKKINNEDLDLSVEHLMTRLLYCIHEDASIEMAASILAWNNIHHLPIENYQGELVGILTDGMISRMKERDDVKYVSQLMNKNVITVDKKMKISELISKLQAHNLFGLPVVSDKKLIGMITLNDLRRAGYNEDHMAPNLSY